MYAKAAQRLKAGRKILLASHIHPDGDAIGSLIALGEGLKTLGQEVTLYNQHPVPPAYRFLPGCEKITGRIHSVDSYDLAVVLDCSKIKRVGDIAADLMELPLINIDHHCSNELFGDIRLVEPESSATVEIVYRLLKTSGITVNNEMAYAIYTGIVTDTSSFSFHNTTAGCLKICGEMIEAGVDPHEVSRNVYITYSSERIRFMQMVLDSFVMSKDKKISFMLASHEMIRESGMRPDNVGRIVNYAKHIEDVKVSALALEEHEQEEALPEGRTRFHVSLRSDGSIDVSRLAVKFGGGGHYRAAGFNINETFEGVRDTILRLAEEI